MNPNHTDSHVQPRQGDGIRLPAFILGFLFVIIGSTARAAAVPNTGAIEGRIFDLRTSAALANAGVAIEGAGKTTATDESGRFLPSTVPVGTARLVVEYIGLEKQTVSATVSGPLYRAGAASQRPFQTGRAIFA